MTRTLSLLIVLTLAGHPAAAAACALDCVPPEGAGSGCHEHPAMEQERTRVTALHTCGEIAGVSQYALGTPSPDKLVVSIPTAGTAHGASLRPVADVTAVEEPHGVTTSCSLALALSSALRI